MSMADEKCKNWPKFDYAILISRPWYLEFPPLRVIAIAILTSKIVIECRNGSPIVP